MIQAKLSPECQAILQRVLQAKQINKLNNEKIAKEAGMRVPTISNQFNGYYSLDIRVLLAVAKLCPNISAEYLLRGRGDIICNEDSITGLYTRIEQLEERVNNIARMRIL